MPINAELCLFVFYEKLTVQKTSLRVINLFDTVNKLPQN